MVTRFPNHWCASSCVITSATRFCTLSGAVRGSSRSATSRKVIAPAFSIAPASKSGKLQELDAPPRLERGLVETGEDATRVGRFELRHGDRTGTVETSQSGREPAPPRHVERDHARRELVLERERDGLALFVHLDSHG